MKTGIAFLAGVVVAIIVLQLIGKSVVKAYAAGAAEANQQPKQ